MGLNWPYLPRVIVSMLGVLTGLPKEIFLEKGFF
jgi:hypothetical protein